ncbi:phage tail protein I [Thiotrichales bacterium 19X7-9]|nr:phage tail protein I [Thiotrichales bacterium 19X7-9]
MNLLPPNSTELEKAIVGAFETVLNSKDLLIQKLWNADCCPDEFLPYLASFLSVDFRAYNKATNEQKRAMIKSSIDIHRKKGTLGALKRALETIDYQLSLREWYEYNGVPHTFTLDVVVDKNKQINSDLKAIKHLIDANKNVQSSYIFNLANDMDDKIKAGGFVASVHEYSLRGVA